MRSRLSILLSLCLVSSSLSTAAAQLPPDLAHEPAARAAQPISFDEAIGLAARGPAALPASRELAARVRADERVGTNAGQTSVTVMPGGVLTPEDARGFELQVNATQGWNLGGLRGAQRDAARGEREVLEAEARAAALAARLEAARAWILLATLQRVGERFAAQRRLRAERVERAERARARGVGTEDEIAEARASLAEIEGLALAIEGELVSSRIELGRLLGSAAELVAEGPLPAPELPLGDAEAWLAEVGQLPAVALHRLRELAAEARGLEAQANNAPALALGAQVERGVGNSWVLYGIASLNLNLFGQDRRSRAIEDGVAARARADEERARVQAHAELADAFHEVEHAAELARSLEEGLVPALRTLEERRRRRLELGEGDIFSWQDAADRLLSAEQELERVRGELAWARVRLFLFLSEIER